MMTVTLHMLTAPLNIVADGSYARLSSVGSRGAGRCAGEGPHGLDEKVNFMCKGCRAISSAGCRQLHLVNFVDRSSHLCSGMVAISPRPSA